MEKFYHIFVDEDSGSRCNVAPGLRPLLFDRCFVYMCLPISAVQCIHYIGFCLAGCRVEGLWYISLPLCQAAADVAYFGVSVFAWLYSSVRENQPFVSRI